VLDWFKQFVKLMPEEVWAWDNAGNNKYLISGKASLIQNPPSAWAVAKRDAPQVAEKCWSFPPPKGPKGRFAAGNTYFSGAWKFGKNQGAARDLIQYLADRPQAEKLVEASQGFDVPSFEKQLDFKVWAEQGPPKGAIANYPPRGDVVVSISGAPAPVRIGTQMFAQGTMTKMIAQHTQSGKSADQAMAWAESELEGFMRS
jgi:ABC-type glycerol-3-phosphate transport system substrate-binding protein